MESIKIDMDDLIFAIQNNSDFVDNYLEWYAYHDNRMKEYAAEWLKDNGIKIEL